MTIVSAVVRGLVRLELDLVTYVPSNTIAPMITGYEAALPHRRMVPISREEEAVGIIGALSLGGRSGAILMQDNGFGNALTALTTFAAAYHLPLLILANTRGGLGEYNSMIHEISRAVPDLLAACGLQTFMLDHRDTTSGWESTVYEAGRHAKMTHRPVVVLMSLWQPAAAEAA